MEARVDAARNRPNTSLVPRVAVVVGVAIVAVLGAGWATSGATAANVKSASSPTTTVPSFPPPNYAFCNATAKWVGDYSLKVEWELGLNDDHPLPSHMTKGIKAAVSALAKSSSSLSKIAPTLEMASALRRLSTQLNESALPINVVRAEVAYGATGFKKLSDVCPSSMMIMTSTNPLGGVI